MKKLIIISILICFYAASAFAAEGTVHLVYANGNTVTEDNTTYYEFDVQAWLSEGSEILGSGMAYVEYPVALFGESVVYSSRVQVERSGLLDTYGYQDDVVIELYDIINTNDTRYNCFAVTFEASSLGLTGPDSQYDVISTDPLNPSDLLHVRIEAAAEGSGSVLFPGDIPGTENLYYNYWIENFSGGLDISEAVEPVSITFPGEACAELKKFAADWKKDEMIIEWFTMNEMHVAGYILQRSENGSAYEEVASYLDDNTLAATPGANGVQKYAYTDQSAVPGFGYSYRLEYEDVWGNVHTLYEDPVIAGADDAVKSSYPNPFNPSFVVPFELRSSREVSIRLYDMSGKCVRDIAGGTYAPGHYEIPVHCGDLSSGVYILRSDISGSTDSQKMLLVK